MHNFRSDSVKLKDHENKIKFSPPLRNEFENKGIHACDERLGNYMLRNR